MANWTRRNCSVHRQMTAARTGVVPTVIVDRKARAGPKDELVPMAIGLRKVVLVRTVKGDRKRVVPAIVQHVQRPEMARNRAAKVKNHATSGSHATATKKQKRRNAAEPQL